MNLNNLHKTLEAVAPIGGVSVSDPADRSSWRIDFKDEATQTQRDAAQAALLSWVDVPDPVYVPKLLVVERLEAVGKRVAVKQAIANDDYLNDRWLAATEIDKNDQRVRGLFASLGIDPDLILY